MRIRQIIDRLMKSVPPRGRIVYVGCPQEGSVRSARYQGVREVAEELFEQRGHAVDVMVEGGRVSEVERGVWRLIGEGIAESGDLEWMCQRSLGGRIKVGGFSEAG